MGDETSSLIHGTATVELVALREAIEVIGSQSATARLLKVTQGAVSKWLSGKKPLAAEHVLAVEAATGVSKHRLRPDIYPVGIAATCSAPGADLAPAR